MSPLSRRTALMTSLALPAAVMSAGRSARAEIRPLDAVTANALMVMSTDPRLTDWMRLVRAAQLEAACSTPHPYTVFPLTDASFEGQPGLMPVLAPWEAKIASGQKVAFPDTSHIDGFVRRHVVEGKIDPDRVARQVLHLTSLDGHPIVLDGTGSTLRVKWDSAVDGRARTATLDGRPIRCSNAVIYVLSNVATA